ncbi:MAG: DUF1223 domain-containing protein [Gammaproteobacteria bacterium]|nr:DUF1223 domain-containing protein [Gammaproteobacteria bacterium]
MHARAILIAASLTFAASGVAADSVSLDSGADRVHLLELFTSEGCSSCPPAEKWVNELKDDPRLWRRVVPVAFHVDYWDYIGWKDRFASPDYSERQREYARRRYIKSVYTPGLVLAGEEWRSWFFAPRLKLDRGAPVGPLRLEVKDGVAQAEFAPAKAPTKAVELNVAILGFDLETQVRAGENRGRTLTHDFVVLGYTRVPMEPGENGLRATTPLPDARYDTRRTAVAAWVSAAGDPFPVQTVGGWLRR